MSDEEKMKEESAEEKTREETAEEKTREETAEEKMKEESAEEKTREETAEEKMREEAARRLERRRRKMENATQRLALITGQPESSISLNDSYSLDSFSSSHNSSDQLNQLLSNSGLSLGSSPIEGNRMNSLDAMSVIRNDATSDPPLEALLASDPPLETLVRDDSINSLQPSKPISNYIWIILALVSFGLLESGHGYVVGHSCLTLFILTVTSLFFINRIQISSTVGSIISTVLILCGLRASLVKWIIKSVEFVITVNQFFVVYFTTFLIAFQFYHWFITNETLES